MRYDSPRLRQEIEITAEWVAGIGMSRHIDAVGEDRVLIEETEPVHPGHWRVTRPAQDLVEFEELLGGMDGLLDTETARCLRGPHQRFLGAVVKLIDDKDAGEPSIAV